MAIAYLVGAVTRMAAKALGADENAQTTAGLIAGSILAPIDPIGASVNLGHSFVKYGAAEGNETCKKVDGAITVVALLGAIPGTLPGDDNSNNDC